VMVFGGAVVGLGGRLVGKLGSVPASGLLTGVPGVPDWQPAMTATVANRPARSSRANMSPRLLREGTELLQ
jgi:hypothetical protein